MRITILDAATLGADIDLAPICALGDVTAYPCTAPSEIAARVADAEVIVVNKLKMNEMTLRGARFLKLICVTATGFDNVDLAYCRDRGIALCNVPAYSTESVAQITLAMALSLASGLFAYRRYVADGRYTASGVANALTPVYHELSTLTWGVVGGGGIGRRVARMAKALGCRVLLCRRSAESEFEAADIDTLCRESDIVSLHVPLTDETRGMISAERIAAMKTGAILINVARGAVTDESALAAAVESGHLGGLGIDVFSREPLAADSPLCSILRRDNVCLTPHMAWGAAEARARCVAVIAENIRLFFAGTPQNRVV